MNERGTNQVHSVPFLWGEWLRIRMLIARIIFMILKITMTLVILNKRRWCHRRKGEFVQQTVCPFIGIKLDLAHLSFDFPTDLNTLTWNRVTANRTVRSSWRSQREVLWLLWQLLSSGLPRSPKTVPYYQFEVFDEIIVFFLQPSSYVFFMCFKPHLRFL